MGEKLEADFPFYPGRRDALPYFSMPHFAPKIFAAK